ncbi:hypothetical protein BDP55DRAFT_729781 [Colletotrichum godetiae]|uniref:Uncharacterized protein n=1 Tax=Colletotrichum godetiae TaxID=1209918 RepID=A0AAJ0AIA1_9PEZI|nr:uncharacterized protein BDP55DRAFT_729781 [Colletotrichum godetiae]KAK1674403.1 hypothetical protein BDP55DRAFT_729781 [Colletotrichum godetiae]
MAIKLAIRLHNRYTALKAKAKGLRVGSSSTTTTNGGQKQCLWCRILRRKSPEPLMNNADIHAWMSSDGTLFEPGIQVTQGLSGNLNPEGIFSFREGANSRLSVRSNAPPLSSVCSFRTSSSRYSSDEACVDNDHTNSNDDDDNDDRRTTICPVDKEASSVYSFRTSSSHYSSDEACVDSDHINISDNDDNDWTTICSFGEEEETFYDAEDGLPRSIRDMVPLPSTYSPFASDLDTLPSAYNLWAF